MAKQKVLVDATKALKEARQLIGNAKISPERQAAKDLYNKLVDISDECDSLCAKLEDVFNI